MGRRIPTEAFPNNSAMMKTAIKPNPEKPAFPRPTHMAARETRIHPVVLSITPSFFSRSGEDSSSLSPRLKIGYNPATEKWLSLLPLIFLPCQCGTPHPPKYWLVPRKSRVPAEELLSQARSANSGGCRGLQLRDFPSIWSTALRPNRLGSQSRRNGYTDRAIPHSGNRTEA